MAGHKVNISRLAGIDFATFNDQVVVVQPIGNSLNHRVLIFPDDSAIWVTYVGDGKYVQVVDKKFKVGDNVAFICQGRDSKFHFIKPPEDGYEKACWYAHQHPNIEKPEHGEVSRKEINQYEGSYESILERIKEEMSEGQYFVESNGSYALMCHWCNPDCWGTTHVWLNPDDNGPEALRVLLDKVNEFVAPEDVI